MPKFRLEITFVHEYEADPNDYLPGQSAADMLCTDIANCKDDPEGWIVNGFMTTDDVTVQGTVISE